MNLLHAKTVILGQKGKGQMSRHMCNELTELQINLIIEGMCLMTYFPPIEKYAEDYRSARPHKQRAAALHRLFVEANSNAELDMQEHRTCFLNLSSTELFGINPNIATLKAYIRNAIDAVGKFLSQVYYDAGKLRWSKDNVPNVFVKTHGTPNNENF